MKLFAAFAFLFLANVVRGCTQNEEDVLTETLRDDLKQNTGALAAYLNIPEANARVVANMASCSYGNQFFPDFCNMDISGLNLLEVCCYTCKVSTLAPAPIVAETTVATEASTLAPAPTAPETTVATEASTPTESQSEPAEPPKECQDNDQNLNEFLESLTVFSAKFPEFGNNELVQEINNFRAARGDAGFTCAEAKLFLNFGGYTCKQNLPAPRLPIKLEEFCCHTCRPAPELDFGDCTDIKNATTCEERAQCDAGYKTFIMAIGDTVDSLPFPPSQIYCQAEQQIEVVDGTQPIDWNAVANSFVGSGADSCIAKTGLFGDAAANLIGQLPATMPVNGWSEISTLMGGACTATQSYEESFNTLLEAMPDNAEDYNTLIQAVADIVEKYVKSTDPEPTPQQVVDHLVHDYEWKAVLRYLRDNEPKADDPVDVRQAKIMARVFNTAVAKTTDFTALYSVMQQVVKFAYSSGSVLDTLEKIKNNQILRYDETKACVQSALNAIKDDCVATDAKFTTALNNAQDLIVTDSPDEVSASPDEVSDSPNAEAPAFKTATDTASDARLASVVLGLMLLS